MDALDFRYDAELNNPAFFATDGYHEAFKFLRRHDPVHWTHGRNGWDFWSVTKHEDCVAVLRQPEIYCSSRGVMLPYRAAGQEQTPDQVGAGLSVLMSDPPRHREMRKLIFEWFRPQRIDSLEPAVRKMSIEIVNAAAPKGQCDLVGDVAGKLPAALICQIMGVPPKDWPYMRKLVDRLIGSPDPEFQTEGTPDAPVHETLQYFATLVEERRRHPTADLVSALANGAIEGRPLTDPEVLFNCYIVLGGGLETTRNAISGGVLALLQHPRQLAELMQNPALMPIAVEEILRWTSPANYFMRVAVRDAELCGKPIRRGDRVVVWFTSANRDEEVFADPFRFDIKRTPNDHLAFGYGEHFCLGARLARLETRVMLEEILRGLPGLELAGEVERMAAVVVSVIKRMPVRFSPIHNGQSSH